MQFFFQPNTRADTKKGNISVFAFFYSFFGPIPVLAKHFIKNWMCESSPRVLFAAFFSCFAPDLVHILGFIFSIATL